MASKGGDGMSPNQLRWVGAAVTAGLIALVILFLILN